MDRPPLTGDFAFDVARGAVPDVSAVIKFGRNEDFEGAEDLLDAGGTWVAPTQARIHNIVSGSASDDAAAGVGARTLRIWGLTSWSTPEVSEDIVLDGIVPVPTANAYVIIHRMQVLTKGATSVNVGLITATAVTDATVTASIAIGLGQTQMAIYGIPSGETGYMPSFQASISSIAGMHNIDVQLLVNPEPDVELLNFVQKHRLSILGGGSSAHSHVFSPYMKIPGPALIKLRVTGSAATASVDGGFDLYLRND